MTNPPTPGFLPVNIEGNIHTFYAPFENKVHLYQIGGLPADGLVHSIETAFSLESSCLIADTYTAPTCPLVCDFYAKLFENNCCKSCSSGNLEVFFKDWKEEYEFIVSENLALYKPSKYAGYSNSNNTGTFFANDGKLPGDPNAVIDYVFTPAVSNPSWELDLVGVYDVETMTIWGRTDCCPSETYDYIVFTSPEPFPALPYTELINEPNIANFNQTVVGGSPFTIPINQTARFVRIQKVGYGSFYLGEVEVIGSGNGNSNPYSYQWSDPAVGNERMAGCLPLGNACVTITDNQTQCTVVACQEITN